MNLAPYLLAVLAGGMLLASVPGASLDTPHAVYNQGPDGTSHLLASDVVVWHASLRDLPMGTLVVAAPVVAYSDAEAAAVRTFLQEGGRVVVADDRGSARGLLARMDLGLAIAGPVVTPVFDEDPRSPLVQAQGIAGWPPQLSLHRPAAVTGQGSPLLQSHELAWLDLDEDGRPDIGEPRDRYAFARLRAVGQGELLVIGVADVFDNAGHPLQEGLLAWATEDGRLLIIDEAHRPAVDPVGMADVLAGRAAWVPWLLVPAVLVVAFRTFQVRPVRVRARRRRIAHETDPILEELDP